MLGPPSSQEGHALGGGLATARVSQFVAFQTFLSEAVLLAASHYSCLKGNVSPFLPTHRARRGSRKEVFRGQYLEDEGLAFFHEACSLLLTPAFLCINSWGAKFL